MQIGTTNTDEINIRLYGVNAYLGTTCHGSFGSVTGCSLSSIYPLLSLIHFIYTMLVVSGYLMCFNENDN